MFDHCKLDTLDFLGNVLKIFELIIEKMLTLGTTTVVCMLYLYFICLIYSFYIQLNSLIILKLNCYQVPVLPSCGCDITIPHFSCVSISNGISPNCSTFPKSLTLQFKETIYFSNCTVMTFIPLLLQYKNPYTL